MYPAIRDNLDQLLTLNPLTKQKSGKCPTKKPCKTLEKHVRNFSDTKFLYYLSLKLN